MTRTTSKSSLKIALLAAGLLAATAAFAETPTAAAPPTATPAPAPMSAEAVAERDAMRELLLAAAERPGDPYGDVLLAQALKLMAMPLPPDSPGGAAPKAIPDAALVVAADALIAGAKTHAAHDWRVPATLLLAAQPGAEADELAAQLLASAPDNAFAHVLLMGKTWNAEHPEMFVGHAHRAGAATRYQSLFPSAPAAFQRRLGPAATPDTLTWAFSIAGATALPAYQHFSTPCRAAEGTLAARCLHVAALMMRDGDAWIDAAIGTSIVEALGDATLRVEAAAKAREREWQMDAWRVLAPELEKDPAAIARFADELAEHGEIVAARHMLAAEGVPLTPPADWHASSERPAAAPPPTPEPTAGSHAH
jgi:hypothetical protein